MKENICIQVLECAEGFGSTNLSLLSAHKTSRLLKGVEVTDDIYRGVTHLISIKVVGSGMRVQVLLVENDIFGLACLQNTCFLEKARTGNSNVRLYRGKEQERAEL
jgi:hypothetical protein